MAAEQPQDKYVLRLPDGMRDRLKAEAARLGRSMNNEIIYRLLLSLGDAPDGPEVKLNIPLPLQRRIAQAAIKHNATPNEEILNILYQVFPEPKTASEAAHELASIADVLRPAATIPNIENLVRKLEQLAYDIQRGKVPVANDVRHEVADRYEQYGEDRLDELSRPPTGEDE